MPDEYEATNAFRGARFSRADLTGATFRDCDFSGVRVIGANLTGLCVDGFVGERGVVVNDVDVTPYVEAELDRRNPERVAVRAARTAEQIRTAWSTLEALWVETLARAERLPESARSERVGEEWSFVETLRHLVFAVDVWIVRMLRGEKAFSPLGLPPTDYPAEGARELGIDIDARVPYAEAVDLFAAARARMRAAVEEVSEGKLDEVRTGVPAPAWGEESHSVRACLRVMLDEFCAHRRYAERDLAVLEATAE